MGAKLILLVPNRHPRFKYCNLTKTCLYNFDPLKPHFYIVKLGFTGVNIIIFFISAQNIDCGYSLERPRRGVSNEYPQSMFEKYEKYQSFFLSENVQFLEAKFSIYLDRRTFVMKNTKYKFIYKTSFL